LAEGFFRQEKIPLFYIVQHSSPEKENRKKHRPGGEYSVFFVRYIESGFFSGKNEKKILFFPDVIK
jgi:hypothetical protein